MSLSNHHQKKSQNASQVLSAATFPFFPYRANLKGLCGQARSRQVSKSDRWQITPELMTAHENSYSSENDRGTIFQYNTETRFNKTTTPCEGDLAAHTSLSNLPILAKSDRQAYK